MSYIICNMKKLKRGDIPPVEKENERDENYKGSNAQIKSERTKNNYTFVKREQGYLAYVNQRIKDLGCRTKKDTVLLCSMVVSASPDFFDGYPPEIIKEYFRMCYNFFARKYGEKNIVSAVVHMDETTPHMHLNLMPVLDGRLCCKKLFDRTGLRNLQTDIYEEVGKHWGLKRGEQGSKTKHLDVAEYKAKKAEEKADELEQLCDEKRLEYLDSLEAIDKLKSEKEESESDIAALTAKKETLEKEVADIAETHAAVTAEVNKPIPIFGKADEIKALRAKNALLQKENAKKDRTIDIAHEDNRGLFEELKEEQRKRKESDLRADISRNAALEAEDIKSVFPNEYAELLRRTKEVKSTARKKSNYSGRSK